MFHVKQGGKNMKYTKSVVSIKPTYRTVVYGNLLSDSYQAEVSQSSDGTWSAWIMNLSNPKKSTFRLGYQSKGWATRWTNKQLKILGIE